jgi:coenzyme F420-0:L-glutamate ligase/coenzyme F420-1:gamma-L-glutamate ligase
VDAAKLELTALPGLPLVEPGDGLAQIILDGIAAAGTSLSPGDVLVMAQKIVSKAEGRYADLADVTPSDAAVALAAETDKDARLVELILSESTQVLRHRPNLVIVLHKLGLVMANAGIDASNIEPGEKGERVLLLPEDPDASARRLSAELGRRTGVAVAVVISDSVGRAWRRGIVGTAIGAAGLATLVDLRGEHDLFGRPLMVTQIAPADEIAAAASLLQGQGNEGRPVVLVRGLSPAAGQGTAGDLVRPAAEDMFR